MAGCPLYLKNVATLNYDRERCTGCGMCANVCPHGVFSIKEKRAMVGERDACMECGACMVNCPESAIFVKTGVGCASAVINAMLGNGETCCG